MRTKVKYLLEPGRKPMISQPKVFQTLMKCENDRKILLNTLQKAWLKHTMDETEMGWQELGELMGTTLAEVMGDKDFCEWAEKKTSEKVV